MRVNLVRGGSSLEEGLHPMSIRKHLLRSPSFPTRKPWPVLALALLAALPFAAAEAGQDVDAVIGPKQRFVGRLAYAGDLDVLEFDALAGTEVSLVVRAVKDSGARPRVALLAPGGTPLPGKEFVVAGGREHRLLRVKIQEDGLHRIAIDGHGLGSYRLKVRESLPAKVSAKFALGSGATQAVAFPGRAGTLVRVVVETAKDGIAPLPELVAPDGQALALTSFALATSPSRIEIGPFPLESDGTFELRFAGAAALAKVAVKIDLDPPAQASATIVEPAGAAHVAGGVDLLDGEWEQESVAEEFAAEELIVRLAPGADAAAIARDLGLSVLAESPRGFVRLGVVRERALDATNVASTPGSRAHVLERVRAAAARPGVLAAEPHRIRRSCDVVPDSGDPNPTNDPFGGEQWDLPIAGFDRAAELEQGDDSAFVAVIDTGIRFEHPDLASRLLPGYDFVSDAWNAGDGTGIDPDATDPLIWQGTHGTHVAGTICAVTDNGFGIRGATRLGKVMPLRALGMLGGTDFDIAQAVLYAARLPNASGKLPAKRAQVINLSLGGAFPSLLLEDAIEQALAAGVVVVAAAGNAGSKLPFYPAAFEGVIAVGATDRDDQRAYYSSFGKHLSIAAPGGDPYADVDGDGVPDGVLSTVFDPGYGATFGRKAGTSMAAPHVAAAAFLLRSADPTLGVLEVRALLAAGAEDLGLPGHDKYYGAGRLDAGRSLEYLLGQGEAQGFVHAPATVAFGSSATEREVALVAKGGVPSVAVLGVAADAHWLDVVAFESATPLTARLAVDRSTLLPGTYHGNVEFTTATGTHVVAVSVEVPSDAPLPHVHAVHVVAIDAATRMVVAVTEASAQDGGLFEFDTLPEGTYSFVAATDLDLDGIAAEDHDYAGIARDAATDAKLFALPNGALLSPITIGVESGGAVQLEGKYGKKGIALPVHED
jgi:subtilisin family serine protease